MCAVRTDEALTDECADMHAGTQDFEPVYLNISASTIFEVMHQLGLTKSRAFVLVFRSMFELLLAVVVSFRCCAQPARVRHQHWD